MDKKNLVKPAHDRIQVEYGGTAARLTLMDLYGRPLKQIPVTTGSLVIMVSDLPSGMYILKGGADVRKFVKD